MRYMIIVKATPESEAGCMPGEDLLNAMADYHGELARAGVLLGAQSLAPQSRATRVRVEGGKARAVDGPCAEAKEMIGGFFHVDVATHAEAVALAARCPAAEWATVEVRALAPCYES